MSSIWTYYMVVLLRLTQKCVKVWIKMEPVREYTFLKKFTINLKSDFSWYLYTQGSGVIIRDLEFSWITIWCI